LAILSLSVAALGLLSPWRAPHAQADVGPFHWGYSAMFGRGTYRLADGSEVEVYRGAFGKTLRATPEESAQGPGIRLLLPVSVGLRTGQEGDMADAPGTASDETAPNRVRAGAFVPGVELEFPATKRWTVRTRAQLGWGEELEERGDGERTSAALAAAGFRSRLAFRDVPGRPSLINGLLWAGFESSEDERRSLLRLTNGLEFDIRVPRWNVRGHSMRLLPHVLREWYYRPPPALAIGEQDNFSEVESEWQLGLAAGRETPFKIWFFEFDAVGIAYRFSDQSEGIRLYLNSVF
jgi:hypothetical protein